MIDILTGSVVCLLVIYYALIKPHRYWSQRNVEQGTPVPFFGEMWGPLFRVRSFPDVIKSIYQMSPELPYVGFYQFFSPNLAIRDPDIIKKVTVKDFDHFVDHRQFIPEDVDPLVSKNLMALTGQKWKDMRATLSPAFTGSKMKFMLGLITKTSHQLVDYLARQTDPVIAVEMKDVCTRYANDVIASAVFGVSVDSLVDRENEFYLMGKEVTNFTSPKTSLKLIGCFLAPKLYSIFKIQLFSSRVKCFFRRLVSDSIRQREQKGIVRPDMIHLLLEARKQSSSSSQEIDDSGDESTARISNSKKQLEITEIDITSHALIFFFAGFETVSTMMCFATYELAVNADIQSKLYQEISSTHRKCAGNLTYEALSEMKYLDMVVSETMRKWPLTVATDRICTKPYTLDPPDGSHLKPLHIEKGVSICIPIYGIHRDARFYPEPDRFDPERFSDDNKENIKPYTYLPFGIGPRMCIASRFALMEAKIFLYHLIYNFEVIVTEETEIPLKLHKAAFALTATNGFRMGLKRRDHHQ